MLPIVIRNRVFPPDYEKFLKTFTSSTQLMSSDESDDEEMGEIGEKRLIKHTLPWRSDFINQLVRDLDAAWDAKQLSKQNGQSK